MVANKTYGVDVNGGGGKVLRMGIDKPARDRKVPTAPWRVQFWIKSRDESRNKEPHAQFCIFVLPDVLRDGLRDGIYHGKSEKSKDFSISVDGADTRRVRVRGFYETGNEGATTEVDTEDLNACLEDLFRRLDADD